MNYKSAQIKTVAEDLDLLLLDMENECEQLELDFVDDTRAEYELVDVAPEIFEDAVLMLKWLDENKKIP